MRRKIRLATQKISKAKEQIEEGIKDWDPTKDGKVEVCLSSPYQAVRPSTCLTGCSREVLKLFYFSSCIIVADVWQPFKDDLYRVIQGPVLREGLMRFRGIPSRRCLWDVSALMPPRRSCGGSLRSMAPSSPFAWCMRSAQVMTCFTSQLICMLRLDMDGHIAAP